VNDTDSPKGDRKVVDCANSVLKDHSYWPLVSDLINLFSHRDVALYFMSDTTLLTHWANIMACFQGLVFIISFARIFRSLIRSTSVITEHIALFAVSYDVLFATSQRVQRVSFVSVSCLEWVFMAVLWNRAGHYSFALWFISSSSSFPRLISAAADWMSTILLHMVWP